jgi:MinD-like ATPase involved in chromosome partitioning or flagellar assembly
MTIGLLVALTGASAETAALAAVAEARGAVHIVRRCLDIPDLLSTAATRQATVALVSVGFRGFDSDTVSRLADEDIVTIGVVDELDSADHARLRRMGVIDVLASHELGTVATFVIGTMASRVHGSTPGRGRGALEDDAREERGRQIAVWGPTGAPGRSTVALGIAAELGRRGLATLLVDGDVYGGTIAQQLGILDEASGLLAAARAANAGDLTTAQLERHCRAVGPLLQVLTGLPRADRWPEIRPVLMAAILSTARQWAAWTVLDCGFSLERDEELTYDTAAPRRNGATVAILESVDEVVVVGNADPVGLTRLARALTELDTVVRPGRVTVVVNRHRPTIGWSADDVRAVLEKFGPARDLAMLPNDPAACDEALVQGKTVIECAPGSRLVQALAGLTSTLTGTTEPTRSRLWRRGTSTG